MPSGHRPPIPPGYARVAILGSNLGHAWTQVFYLQLSGSGITAADLNTLAGDIGGYWNTDIAPTVPSSVTATQCDVVYVPSVGNEITGSATFSHSGSSGGTIINDASACFVVNWNISAYYRGGHPRWYLPGVATGDVTNGSVIASARLGFVATAAENLRTAINGATTTNITGVTMGTMSFQQGNAWRGTPLFRPFTGASVRAILGSQRRRLTT